MGDVVNAEKISAFEISTQACLSSDIVLSLGVLGHFAVEKIS